jgi:hypothetical protein
MKVYWMAGSIPTGVGPVIPVNVMGDVGNSGGGGEIDVAV